MEAQRAPTSPHEGRELGGGEGPYPPTLAPALCGPAASGAGPDSRLPIFSFAASALFVLYIYIHPQREPAPAGSEEALGGGGAGRGPALGSHPPSVPMPTAGTRVPRGCPHGWQRSGPPHPTLLWGPGVCEALARVHSLIHQTETQAVPHPQVPDGRRRGAAVQAFPLRSPRGTDGNQCSAGIHGVGEAGGEVSRQSPPREAAGSLLSRGNLMAWRDGVWLSWRGRWGRWNHGDGIGEASRLRSWG